MNLPDLTHSSTLGNYPIPVVDFNSALTDLTFRSAQWHRANYGETCRICVESEASRQLLLAALNHMMELQRFGQDFSAPLVALSATMLQIGYAIGRKRAEADVLEGWMKL